MALGITVIGFMGDYWLGNFGGTFTAPLETATGCRLPLEFDINDFLVISFFQIAGKSSMSILCGTLTRETCLGEARLHLYHFTIYVLSLYPRTSLNHILNFHLHFARNTRVHYYLLDSIYQARQL